MVTWKLELATGHGRSGTLQIPGDAAPGSVFLLAHSGYRALYKTRDWDEFAPFS